MSSLETKVSLLEVEQYTPDSIQKRNADQLMEHVIKGNSNIGSVIPEETLDINDMEVTKSTVNNDKIWPIFRKGFKPKANSILPPWYETAPLPVNDNYPFFLASSVKCNHAGSNRSKFLSHVEVNLMM